MSTPEGRVKARLKRILDAYRPNLYHHWPVQNGMGSPTLDCNGAINGRAFSIECKAFAMVLTDRQLQTRATMEVAGVKVFLYDGTLDTESPIVRWLDYWRVRGMIEEGL